MKIDRLLAIVMLLLSRDTVSARELAKRFEVSLRTIQRDMDSIGRAGIPVFARSGAGGGYGIMESFKLDRALMTEEDLSAIVTALKGVQASFADTRFLGALEKVGGIAGERAKALLSDWEERLILDFSALGGNERLKATLRELERSIERRVLIRFTYSNNKREEAGRTVEPMTLVFQWRSWYLFAFCLLKGDYRLFRVAGIRDLEITEKHFIRRKKTFRAYAEENPTFGVPKFADLTLRFHPTLRPQVEELYERTQWEEDSEGYLIVKCRMPEERRLYGSILAFGKYVEVLAPEDVRESLRLEAREIIELYEKLK
jgi:predicted DNA-binding transcriptional regulator YafY